jgi:hypothetical protein
MVPRARSTASCFDKIITNKTAKLSASCEGYACQLLAEQIIGAPVDLASATFMERGEVLERKAVEWYELQRDCDTEQIGFILRDDRRVGCSPDRLVGDDGILEIKCPSVANHLSFLLGADSVAMDYRAQVQGQLWITGRQWVDTLSYNPDLPNALVRIPRDEDFIGKLAAAVDQFLSFMDESKLTLQRYGLFKDFKAPTLRAIA